MTRLLFVRHLEDREIGTWRRGALLDRVSNRTDCVSQVAELFADLQSQFNSELFPAGSAAAYRMPAIQGPVLNRFVTGLYRLDSAGVNYDFGLLESDSLGLLYQQFAGVRWPRDARQSQIQLLGKASLAAESVREKLGVFYTPTSVVDTVLELTLGARLSNGEDGLPPTVLDLSAGSGVFLSRAFEYMARRSAVETREDAAAWIARLHGADIDPRAIAIARLNLWMAFARRFDSAKLPSLARTVRVADSLADDTDARDESIPALPSAWRKDGFDVIVGNPPFLSHKDAIAHFGAGRVKQWRARHRSGTKEVNLAALFVERALRLLRPGGYLGMVVPRNLLKTESGESLRRLIRHTCEIVYVVDCLDMKLFTDADEHSAIVVLRRPRGSAAPVAGGEALILGDGNAQTFAPLAVLRHAPIVPDRILHHSLNLASENAALASDESSIGYEPIWTLEDAQGRCTLERLHASIGPHLSDVVASHYALDEGLRGAFVLSSPRVDGKLIDARSSALGMRVQVERAITRPAIRPTDISALRSDIPRRDQSLTAGVVVLYPYDAKGRVLDWTTIKRDAPRAAQYLKRLELGLVGRRGHGASDGWWVPRAVRKSAPWHLSGPRDSYVLMSRHSAWPRAMVVPANAVAVGGGIAWTVRVGNPIYPKVVLALASSRLWWWYAVISGSIGAGKHYRVRPGVWDLLSVPASLLGSTRMSRRIVALLGKLRPASAPDTISRIWVEVDGIIEDAYGLTGSERDHVSAVLDVYTAAPRIEWLRQSTSRAAGSALSLFSERHEDV